MAFLDLPKRFYTKLPEWVRNRLRIFKNPRMSIIIALVRFGTGNQVVQGPFKALSLKTWDCSPPMLLGTYEQELHDVFHNWLDRKPRYLVCIGAAQGYYAVGMARRDPNLKVIAYELDSYQRSQLAGVIRQNKVSNVTVLKNCTQESLVETLQRFSSPPFIVCDIEGGEVELLDPIQITALKQAVILVEIHEELVNGCEQAIRSRFKDSHNILEIISLERISEDLSNHPSSFLSFLSEKTKLGLIDEGRASTMKWLVLEPDSICN
jgi:hypothetical protein